MDNADFRDLIAERLRTLRCEQHFDPLYRMGRFAELKLLAKYVRQQTSHFSDSNEFEKYNSRLIRDGFEEVHNADNT